MTLDQVMTKLRANPRFKLAPPSGKGFVIGGGAPRPPKAKG
jgi:hypothetical protein